MIVCVRVNETLINSPATCMCVCVCVRVITCLLTVFTRLSTVLHSALCSAACCMLHHPVRTTCIWSQHCLKHHALDSKGKRVLAILNATLCKTLYFAPNLAPTLVVSDKFQFVWCRTLHSHQIKHTASGKLTAKYECPRSLRLAHAQGVCSKCASPSLTSHLSLSVPSQPRFFAAANWVHGSADPAGTEMPYRPEQVFRRL